MPRYAPRLDGIAIPRRRPSFMAQPFRHPLSGIFYLRRKVPSELREALGREFKRSLSTHDPATAKARFARAWDESEQAFSRARAELVGTASLSRRDADQLAARWVRREQERAEREGVFSPWLTEGSGAVAVDPADGAEYPPLVTLEEALADGSEVDVAAVVAPFIRSALRAENLPTPPRGSDGLRFLESAFEEHLHRLSRWALVRHGGGVAPVGLDVTPMMPLESEKASVGVPHVRVVTLMKVFDAYAAEKRLNDGNNRATRKSIDGFRAVIQRVVDLNGDMDVRAISREVVARLRGELALFPSKGLGLGGLKGRELIEKAETDSLPRLSEPTIRNHLRALSAVLSLAVRMQWIDENPVIASGAGRAAAKAASKRAQSERKRKDFSRAELRAIFGSAAFTVEQWTPPRADFGAAWQWVPLLLHYTGARREEIAQLLVSDLSEEGGIPYLSILAADDESDVGRTVKTHGSRRLVPLHKDLLARGLLAYASGLPAKGLLFPKLSPNSQGFFGANFAKRWAQYLRTTVGVQSSVSPLHGFRHTFKTLCREIGMPEDVHDAITGHTSASKVARAYGSMPLTRMAAELNRFPAVSSL